MALATTTRRHIPLASLAGLLVIGAAAGGATWYASRCDRDSYLNQATTSWVNDREQYLFACGQVWHSLDAGQTWQRIASSGLPRLVREGRIAEDRAPGQLYLATLLDVHSSLQCPLCPLTRVQPVMFLSQDGGRDWQLVHRFQDGPIGLTYFRSVSADPEYSNAAWVELVARDEVFYLGTNSAGREWAIACTAPIDLSCSHVSDFSAAPHAPPSSSP